MSEIEIEIEKNGTTICIDQNENNDYTVYYSVRKPWEWVIKAATSESNILEEVLGCSSVAVQQKEKRELPSFSSILGSNNEETSIKTVSSSAAAAPCTLRMEIVKNNNNMEKNERQLIQVIHGTSSIMNEMEDKDEWLRIVLEHKCEYIIPDSILIPWDVSREHMETLVKNKFMAENNNSITNLIEKEEKDDDGQNNNNKILILKTPLGSRGEGIYFFELDTNNTNIHTTPKTTTMDDLYEVIKKNYNNAKAEKGFLDYILQYKKRIPSWVFQKEVYPPLLIQRNQKFHLRSYLVLLESSSTSNKKNTVFIYNRHEVRISPVAYKRDTIPLYNNNTTNTAMEEEGRLGHITNGACGDSTERKLLHTIEELTCHQTQSKLELFLAKAFGMEFDMFMNNKKEDHKTKNSTTTDKFAVCGIDIMMDEDGRFYILEINVNPAAPPEDSIDTTFREHLIGFMNDLIALLIVSSRDDKDEKRSSSICNFVNVQSILDTNENK